jgi:hypothetical protein
MKHIKLIQICRACVYSYSLQCKNNKYRHLLVEFRVHVLREIPSHFRSTYSVECGKRSVRIIAKKVNKYILILVLPLKEST